MKKKVLWFSITKKDLELQTFRSGGKGGQHQNKSNTGVRIIHKDSGAVGEAPDSRSQKRNRKAALERLVKSNKFHIWLNNRLHGETEEEIIKKVSVGNIDECMHPKNLLIEIRKNGQWQSIQ